MQAELDMVNGNPVLRLEVSTGLGHYRGRQTGKRAVFDVKLTAEQAQAIRINVGVFS